MRYLTNGFSLGMLRDPNMKIYSYRLPFEEFKAILHSNEFYSVIGHEDLSECLTRITGKKIPYNRQGIKLDDGDELIVVYLRKRLTENDDIHEYLEKLNYSYVRFEKQTHNELRATLNHVETILGDAMV